MGQLALGGSDMGAAGQERGGLVWGVSGRKSSKVSNRSVRERQEEESVAPVDHSLPYGVCVCVEHGELAQTSTRRAIPSQKAEVGVTQEAGNLF